jgi:hypothetical protein
VGFAEAIQIRLVKFGGVVREIVAKLMEVSCSYGNQTNVEVKACTVQLSERKRSLIQFIKLSIEGTPIQLVSVSRIAEPVDKGNPSAVGNRPQHDHLVLGQILKTANRAH